MHTYHGGYPTIRYYIYGFVYRDAEMLHGVQRVGTRSLRRVGGLLVASEQVQRQLLQRYPTIELAEARWRIHLLGKPRNKNRMKTLMIMLPVLLTIAGVVYSVFW
jgi:hypothetical protein